MAGRRNEIVQHGLEVRQAQRHHPDSRGDLARPAGSTSTGADTPTAAAKAAGGHDALEAGLPFSVRGSRDVVESDCQQLDGACATEVEGEQCYTHHLRAAEQRRAMLQRQHARRRAKTSNVTVITCAPQSKDQQCYSHNMRAAEQRPAARPRRQHARRSATTSNVTSTTTYPNNASIRP